MREPRAQSRRRIPIRYLVVASLVLIVAGSERFGGPLTVETLRNSGTKAVSAAFDEVRDRNATGEVHLTFDDGPSLAATPRILDVLEDHGATAVFFPIGNQVEGGAEVLRRAVADGHRIGNHTWNHDRLVEVSPAEFDAAVGRTQIAIERTTGVVPRCLRPPGGEIDDAARSLADADGLSVESWDLDPRDWRRPGTDEIVRAVVDGADDGVVVLLHDGGGDRAQTVAALDELLERLGSRGYRFTALPGC